MLHYDLLPMEYCALHTQTSKSENLFCEDDFPKEPLKKMTKSICPIAICASLPLDPEAPRRLYSLS